MNQPWIYMCSPFFNCFFVFSKFFTLTLYHFYNQKANIIKIAVEELAINSKDDSCHNEYIFPSFSNDIFETATLEGALCYWRKKWESTMTSSCNVTHPSSYPLYFKDHNSKTKGQEDRQRF